MKNIILVLASILTLVIYSCSNNTNAEIAPLDEIAALMQQQKVIINVNVEQFKKLVTSEKGTVLDVRTPGEWAEGTIANAEKIDYYNDNFATEIEKLDKTKPVFVYCKKGGRSSSAAEILKEKGFTKVFNLDGGISAWLDAGQEIVK